MDWDKGFSAKYYAAIVDRMTWRDESFIEITGGSIQRSDTDLRQSADVSCKGYNPTKEEWLRVYLDAKQGSNSIHMPLFTGLISAPDKAYNSTSQARTLQCYSVLKPLQDVLLPKGWYAESGLLGSTVIEDLMKYTPAPFVVENPEAVPKLEQDIIAEDKENCLTMIDKILVAIGWRLRVDGNGVIYLCPPAEDYSVMYDPRYYDAIEPEINITYDWYSCPNVLRVSTDNYYYVARDEESKLSVNNRGREVWAEETSVTLNNGESLIQYGNRRLKELQQTAVIVSYKRRYHPNLLPTDIVHLAYPQQELMGNYYISNQNIEISYGATVTEEVRFYDK